MALFDRALIAFSMSDVGFYDLARNERTRRVHLLLTEYGKDQYVLLLCELADGALVCDDPPRVIKWVPIPNKRVNFDFSASSKRIDISVPIEWSFSLVFGDAADYWEIVRIIAEVTLAETLHMKAIDELVQEAIGTIPTMRLYLPSPTDGGNPAITTEDVTPSPGDGAQTPVGESAPSPVSTGAPTLQNAE